MTAALKRNVWHGSSFTPSCLFGGNVHSHARCSLDGELNAPCLYCCCIHPAFYSCGRKYIRNIWNKDNISPVAKRDMMPVLDNDSGSDREDELPQVVVLKGGDLTAEEVKKINAEMHTGGGSADKDDGPPPGGKIFFKKPAKRSSSDKFQGLTASSNKKKKSDEGEKEMKPGKKVKNNSLLSFGGDEEKDED
ncbi:uncharacterized protein KIAA1143 homolog isoform X1 [Platichthys flesus]|uniref:uncharacterized protein KIAA1143 homolog isoform X1 n=1 Tax=Platichthys flesus TaxID=8260 RepID=UPI002DBAA9D4|nr:uncharacterized protein KIAA1143 homolog isoform X1 [Platichthys flesus]